MLKKLLYLYNDGHNPFPKGKGGLGYKPPIIGGMIREEDEPVDVDQHYENMVSNWDEVSRMFSSETVANDMFKEDWLMGQIHDFEGHPEYQKFFQEIYNNIKHPDQPEIDLNDYDYDKFYRKNFEYHEDRLDDEYDDDVDETIGSESFMKIPYSRQNEIIDRDYSILVEKHDKQKLEIKKYKAIRDKLKPIVTEELAKYVVPFHKREIPKEQVKLFADVAVKITSNVTPDNYKDPSVLENCMQLIKDIPKIELLHVYAFIEWFTDSNKVSKTVKIKYDFLQGIILDKLYPKYTKSQEMIDKIIDEHNETIRKMNDLVDIASIVKKKFDAEQQETKKSKSKEKKLIQQEKKLSHEEKLQAEIDARNEREKLNPVVESQAAEEPKKKSKPKKVKPVKKSEEETQAELLSADVSGRLETIEQTMSSNGKDLEKYLSGNGQTVLHYISGDRSKVHDNEMNEAIPNIKITLTNGKVEDLRKAVTIDLYNDDHAYEIKNYKEYSITDKVIPVQESKLEGTGYFIPYYLKNGNLYNIQLNYTDPKTGKEEQKFILPENPNGRILHLVYRLQDGLYEFKPLETQYISLKSTPLKSKDGQPLYMFKGTTLKRCKDHHGNNSFNIQPYLRKIKT